MPKREDEKTISIRFPAALMAELRRLATEQHRSVNGTVLEACERYIRQMRARQAREADR